MAANILRGHFGGLLDEGSHRRLRVHVDPLRVRLLRGQRGHLEAVIARTQGRNEKVYYSAPRLNGHPFCSHILAVKAGWPFIRANLIENPSLVIEKSAQLSGMAVYPRAV